MRNESRRNAKKKALSFELGPSSPVHTQNSTKPLFPAEEIEREMAVDGLKISFVAGNDRCADAARSQCDQHIEGKLAKLVPLVVLTTPHDIQQLAGVDPMRFSGRDNPAPIHQIRHKPTFKPRPRATQQLMQHDSRAANHVGSLEKTKGEATSSKIVDIDRGVQNG